MSLESVSDDEILGRTDQLIQEYAQLAPALADQLEKFGRLRSELELLVTEIKARKLPFGDAKTDSAE